MDCPISRGAVLEVLFHNTDRPLLPLRLPADQSRIVRLDLADCPPVAPQI
jgi:hypothetical protein